MTSKWEGQEIMGAVKTGIMTVRRSLRSIVDLAVAHPALCWWCVAVLSILAYFHNGELVAMRDMMCHVTRLDQLADGVLVPTPVDAANALAEDGDPCGNTAVNSPLAYALAILPWTIARSSTENAITAVLLANGILGSGLCALAIALAGRNRWFIMAVCSMPVTLLSIAWVGADTMAIATAMIMLGCVLGLLDSESWLRHHLNAALAIMLLDAVALGCMKSNLCAIAVVPLILPVLLGSKTWSWARAISVFAAQAASMMAWALSVRGIPPITCGTGSCGYYRHGYADRWLQFFSDPLGAVKSIITTTFGWASGDDSFARISIEWSLVTGTGYVRDEGHPTFTMVVALAGLIPLFIVGFLYSTGWFETETGLRSPRWAKCVGSAWCVGFVALTMFMVLMVSPQSVYGGQIIGLQGRYFVYMIPIALLCLPQAKWIKIDDSKTSYQHGSAMMLAASLAALTTIVIPGLIV